MHLAALQSEAVDLPLPAWQLGGAPVGGGSRSLSAVPPPQLAARLPAGDNNSAGSMPASISGGRRRLAQQQLTPDQLAEIQRQQQARQQQALQQGDVPVHQHVPVVLSIGFGGPAVTAPPTSTRILDASTVNTTRCIRYAAWFDAADPSGSRDPAAAQGSSGSEQQAGTEGAAAWRRPPLDLSACQRSVLEVSTASQRVLVQVGWGAGGLGCRCRRAGYVADVAAAAPW